jgi:tetratricopeptide (TPR) repeat protein
MAMTATMPTDMEPALRGDSQDMRADSQEFQQLVLSCNKDGMDYLRKAQHKQAFEQLKYAEAILIAKEGEDEPTNLLAVTCNNLGCYYKKVGKLHAALSYLRKALKIEVSLQTDDVTVAGTHLNICAILSKLDKHDKAVQHASCALELISNRVSSGAESVSHDEYSVLAIAYHNVAVERDYLHQWDQAAAAYQQGHQIAKKCLGDQHPLTQTLAKNSDTAIQKSRKFARDASPAAPSAASTMGRGGPRVVKLGAGVPGSFLPQQQAGGFAVPLLPDISGMGGRGKEAASAQDEALPISVGRTVHQEAEDWMQGEEGVAPVSNWRQSSAAAAAPAAAAFSGASALGSAPAMVSGPALGAPTTPQGSMPGFHGSSFADQGLAPGMGMAEPWPEQPSFLDSIAQDLRTIQGGAPSSPPPLVMMGREKQQQQQVPKQSDAGQELLLDDVSSMARPPRPPRQGKESQVLLDSPVSTSRPPRGPTRTTRAERELARKNAAASASAGLVEQPRRGMVGAPGQQQLLRKTAAEKIQRRWRESSTLKRQSKNVKELKEISATRIQALWRGFHTRRRRVNKHAVIIQKWARGYMVRITMKRHRAAVVLQRHTKGLVVRRQRERMQEACLKIQRLARGRGARSFARTHKQKVNDASLVLQRGARMWQARQIVNEKKAALDEERARIKAARSIQSVFRGSQTRKTVCTIKHKQLLEHEMHEAATKIQAMARRDQATTRVEAMRKVRLATMEAAATIIRKHWLRGLYRSRYLELRKEFFTHESSIITIQRYARGYVVRLKMWRDAIRTEEELWAAVEIQRCWRGYMGRLRWELAYEAVWSREAAAHRIQRYVRGWLARTRVMRLRKRLARAEFMKARLRFKAAQRIQACCRGYMAYKRTLLFRRKRIDAIVRVQKVWRGHLLRRFLWQQVTARRIVQIQAFGRGFLVRNRRFVLMAKVIMIQRKYRHWLRFIPEAERRRRLNRRRSRRQEALGQ